MRGEKMAYRCIKNQHKECDGCGVCNEYEGYVCPECGEVAEEIYISNTSNEIIGCDNCITTKYV